MIFHTFINFPNYILFLMIVGMLKKSNNSIYFKKSDLFEKILIYLKKS